VANISAIALIPVIWMALLISTHLAISVIVYRDAKNLDYSALGISPFLWFGITFSLPIIGMFIYWIMNYSSLSKRPL